MTTPAHRTGRTASEQFLLEWLGKEDFSQYGECHGSSLDALVKAGLAEIHEGRTNQIGFIAQGDTAMHRAVSLTDAGRAALSASRSTGE